jgi:hypothetical protein
VTTPGTAGIQQQVQVPSTLAGCQQVLEEIYNYKQQQKDQLEKIRQFQKQLMMRPQKEGYDVLLQQHSQLKNQITEELRTLQALFQQIILPPAEIHKLIYLLQDLKLQQIQLELFQQELQRLVLPPHHPHLARPYHPPPPNLQHGCAFMSVWGRGRDRSLHLALHTGCAHW